MPNYQLSKIYKIYSPSKNLVYIGSTTQALSQRLGEHLRNYKAYKNDNTKTCFSSFIILDCDDYKIELVEEYPCNNRQQLCKKEGEYIKNIECCNKNVAGRTFQEYDRLRSETEERKVYKKEHGKQYRIDNADKIKEQKRQYRIDNADKIKEHQKQYRTNNVEKLKEYEKLRNQTEERKEYNKQYYLKKKAEKAL